MSTVSMVQVSSSSTPPVDIHGVALQLASAAKDKLISLTGSHVPLPILSRLPQDSSQAIDYPPSKGLSPVEHTDAHLPVLDDAGLALWRALHSFRPLRSDYTTAFQDDYSLGTVDVVKKTFDWDSIQLPEEVEGSFYGVVFRSKRRAGSESVNLYEADRKAHEEAVAHGGLMMYWYGVPDPRTTFNLATCIWTDQQSARAASALPLHKEAVKHAMKAYETFDLSRYKVVKHAGETGVRIEPWPQTTGSYHGHR